MGAFSRGIVVKKWWNGLSEVDRSDVVRMLQIVGCTAAGGFVLLGVLPVLASYVGGLPVF